MTTANYSNSRVVAGRERHLPVLIFALFFAIHLVFKSANDMPLVFNDEAWYLQMARRLAAGLTPFDGGTYFFPGLSILIAPLFLLSQEVEKVFPLIQLFNATVVSFLPVITFHLLPYLAPQASSAEKFLIAVLVGLYPPYIAQANLALPEAVFVTLAALGCLLLFRLAADTRSWKNWLACIVLCLLIPIIHGRGLANTFAGYGAMALLLPTIPWRTLPRRQQLGTAILMTAAVVGLIAVVRWALHRESGVDFGGQHSTYMPHWLSLERTGYFLLSVAGTLWYLSVASVGIFWLGLFVLLRQLYLSRRNFAASAPLVFVLLSLALEMAITKVSDFSSAQELRMSNRGDWLIYGRYLDTFIVPILALGIFGILKLGFARKDLLAQVIVSTVLGLIVYTFTRTYLDTLEIHWFQILGISYLNFGAFRGYNSFITLYATLIGGGLILVVAGAALLRQRLVIALVITAHFIVNIVAASYFFQSHEMLRYEKMPETSFIPVLKESLRLAGSKCVFYNGAIDMGSARFHSVFVPPEVVFEKGFFLDKDTISSGDALNYQMVRSKLQDFPCEVFREASNVQEYYPGSRIIAVSNPGLYFWARPGKVLDKYKERGWILPSTYPGKLEDAAFRAEIDSTLVPCDDGARRCFRVDVAHRGDGSFWPGSGLMPQGFGVGLVYTVFAGVGLNPLATHLQNFPWNVYPGQTKRFTFQVGDKLLKNICAQQLPVIMRLDLEQLKARPFSLTADQATYLQLQCEGGELADAGKVSKGVRDRLFAKSLVRFELLSKAAVAKPTDAKKL